MRTVMHFIICCAAVAVCSTLVLVPGDPYQCASADLMSYGETHHLLCEYRTVVANCIERREFEKTAALVVFMILMMPVVLLFGACEFMLALWILAGVFICVPVFFIFVFCSLLIWNMSGWAEFVRMWRNLCADARIVWSALIMRHTGVAVGELLKTVRARKAHG